MITIYLYVISYIGEDHLPTSKMLSTDRLLGCVEVVSQVLAEQEDINRIPLLSADAALDLAKSIGLGTIVVYKLESDNKSSPEYLCHYTLGSMEDSYFRRKVIEAYLSGEHDRIEIIYQKLLDEENAIEEVDLKSGDLFIRLPHEDVFLMMYGHKDGFDKNICEEYEEAADILGDWDLYITEEPVRNEDDLVQVVKQWMKREFGSLHPHVENLKIVVMIPGSKVIPIRPNAAN